MSVNLGVTLAEILLEELPLLEELLEILDSGVSPCVELGVSDGSILLLIVEVGVDETLGENEIDGDEVIVFEYDTVFSKDAIYDSEADGEFEIDSWANTKENNVKKIETLIF